MTARTVWLASYPKSGNTWVRAIVTALGTHPELFAVDQLSSSGAQPHQLGAALPAFGLDPRWLSAEAGEAVRHALTLRLDAQADDDRPLLRKTHEIYRATDPEPFPREVTRAAILVVRDPRDVACSFASFFGVSIDEAITTMGRGGGDVKADAARAQTAQPWGTWSSHTQSWLDADVPFPVHLVRYEDLVDDAVAAVHPVLGAIGLECARDELGAAVERARFDELAGMEADRGFRGTHPRTERFFRRGVAGGWRDELTPAQADAIVADHGAVMTRLGYTEDATGTPREWARAGSATWVGAAGGDPVAAPTRRSATATPAHSSESYALPESLGLRVREGSLSEDLPDATRPRPWIQVTSTTALLRFRGRAAVLVENGTDVTVDPGHSGADDVGWMVQGWGVTLAMLQRGMLSLHASTVRVGASSKSRVVAVAGQRGAGKSTTAMGLRARGNALLCDDVTIVEFRDGGAWTTPYWRNVHLLADAAAALDVEFDDLPPLGAGRAKAAFRAEEPPEADARIDCIVVLAHGDVDEVVTTTPVGAARMAALAEHADRDGVAPVVLGPERYFAQVAHLADVVPVHVVTRPRGAWSLDAVLDAIEHVATHEQAR